ncbi:MRN complex-interacting protein [Orycteropus afer afer]|uniref:MRN complex-interacting protein n=1 Tax=Orycteropus afer afer TaxID=1230840 RepID=A0AC54ZBX1_ORYAF|nr:MRN complex-interacting protein [Orycteropus afer afer]
MAPPQPVRVLRCCSCRLFQAHQVKKSLKWTCKACGEKQSFLRAYGEGSGADCRRHVQKLNLLQGQVSEMLLSSLEEPVNASKEESAGHQTDGMNLQEKSWPRESRWLKYLEKSSKELELEGEVCFNGQPSSISEKSSPPFNDNLPKKRKWSLHPVQPPHKSTDAQDSGSREVDSKIILQPQGYASLTGKVKQGSSGCLQNSEDWNTSEFTFPQWKPPKPTQPVKAASSKWEQFLLSPGKSSSVDPEPLRPIQTGLRSASPVQPEPRTQSPRKGHPSSSSNVLQPPWVPHIPMSVARKSCRKTAEQPWSPGTLQAEAGLLVKEYLFKTDEDFDDDF